MELAQINQRIAVANAESKRLNNERAINIGKRETLEKQLSDAIGLYNRTYGTNINVAGLNAEIAKVSAEKEQEVLNIENVLNLIKSGDFEAAQNAVSGVENKEVVNVVPQVETVPTMTIINTATGVPVMPTPVTPAVPKVEAPVAPTVPQVEVPVAQPKVPNLSGLDIATEEPTTKIPNLGAPTPVAPPSGLSGLDIPAPPIGRPPVAPSIPTPPKTPNLGGQASTETPVASFNAILGGSQFKPQGNI